MLARIVLAIVSCSCTFSFAADWTADKTDKGVTVKVDGQLFTEYVILSKNKPILYPIIGPGGQKMTRDWPMGAAATNEKTDHPHHRSLWFTHGEVNGVDFWAEEGKGKYGKQIHQEFTQVKGGKTALIGAKTEWIGPDDKKVCRDTRTIECGADGSSRYIDFAIDIEAPYGDVTFGDTKEGSFGVRMPDSIRVDTKLGGRIVTNEGKVDDKPGGSLTWGQPASWVDYSGPIGNDTVGLSILNHPSSFRYPTRWHVRTYGLFAANPFSQKDFKVTDQGAYTLKSGEHVQFRYRILLHPGDEKQGHIAEAWEAYRLAK